MPNNPTRIYDEIQNINYDDVKRFWDKRAQTDRSIKGVLLGQKFAQNSGELRNKKELDILLSHLSDEQTYNVLDIGCGSGRWADNLKNCIKSYTGIDFSQEYINRNKEIFKNQPQIEFFNMSVDSINLEKLHKHYHLMIITGVLMYVNDNELESFFNVIKMIKPEYIYLQESVSILPIRMTLKNFKSDELKSKYNAIYRTEKEYKNHISKLSNSYTVVDSDLLLDEETGAREETNARYWFLKREEK